jgi:hypothetical protein
MNDMTDTTEGSEVSRDGCDSPSARRVRICAGLSCAPVRVRVACVFGFGGQCRSEVDVVKALAIMLANPGISGNKIIPQLHIQKSSCN